MARTAHQLEALSTAFDALTRAGDFMTTDDPRGYVRAENRLLDACIDAGMSHDEPCASDWAARRLTRWLLAA